VREALALIRFLLRFGWLYLLIVSLSQSADLLPLLLPPYIYGLLALAQVAVLHIAIRLTISRSSLHSLQSICLALGLGLLAAGGIQITLLGTRLAVNNWIFVLNFALASFLFWSAIRLATDEPTYYGTVLAEFGRGLLLMVLSTLFVVAYLAGGLDFTHPPILISFALIGYMLAAMLGLAFARRFANDEQAPDRRERCAEQEWIAAMGLFAVILIIFGLVLAQLPPFDVVSGASGMATSLGHMTGALWQSTAVALPLLFKGIVVIVRFFPWLFHLVMAHVAAKVPVPKVRQLPIPKGIDLTRFRGSHLLSLHGIHLPPLRNWRPPLVSAPTHHSGHPPLLARIVTVQPLVIVLIGLGSALIVPFAWAAFALRFGWQQNGQRRTRITWPFSRFGTAGSVRLCEATGARAPQQRYGSVREVYRAFLILGQRRARPKALSETAGEYCAELARRWPHASRSLDYLYTLYAAVRYGAQPDTPAAVQAAIDHLRAIEEASRGKTVSYD
jgi:hypothetical protein